MSVDSNLPFPRYYEPDVLYTGASAYWEVSYPFYDPSVYSLNYYFRSPLGNNFNITTQSGQVGTGSQGFMVLVPPAVTALWKVDAYSWQAVMVDGAGNQFVVRKGRCKVELGLSTTTDPYDDRTFAMKALALIQGQLQNRLPAGIDRYMIGGRDITKIPLTQLTDLEKYYEERVKGELAQEDTKKGRSNRRTLFTQFVAPLGTGSPYDPTRNGGM